MKYLFFTFSILLLLSCEPKAKTPETFTKVASVKQLDGGWFIDGYDYVTNERMMYFNISTVDPSDNFFIWNATSAMTGDAIYFTFSNDGENFSVIGKELGKDQVVFKGTIQINKTQDKLKINRTLDIYGDMNETTIWLKPELLDQ